MDDGLTNASRMSYYIPKVKEQKSQANGNQKLFGRVDPNTRIFRVFSFAFWKAKPSTSSGGFVASQRCFRFMTRNQISQKWALIQYLTLLEKKHLRRDHHHLDGRYPSGPIKISDIWKLTLRSIFFPGNSLSSICRKIPTYFSRGFFSVEKA